MLNWSIPHLLLCDRVYVLQLSLKTLVHQIFVDYSYPILNLVVFPAQTHSALA